MAHERNRLPVRHVLAASVLEERSGEIFEDYLKRLRSVESPLLEGRTKEQLEAQTLAVLKDAASSLRGEKPSAKRKANDISKDVGISRARLRVHPSESLRAVTALYGAALQTVVDNLPFSDAPTSELADVALALQKSIMERVALASISYVEYLLRQVHEVKAQEHRRISRELHDRVNHSLAVVCKSLELYEALKNDDIPRAQEKAKMAREAAEEALKSGTQLSRELRSSEASAGLEVALSDLLRASVPKEVRAWVSVKGDEALLPAHVRDELFLLLREAVRNALAHSGAHTVRIAVVTTPSRVTAKVEDDGHGFDLETTVRYSSGVGLKSMEERASLLGGTWRLRSAPGEGTRVEVDVPLARA